MSDLQLAIGDCVDTFLMCMRCQIETGFPNFGSIGAAIIPDDGVIKHVCDKGHENIMIISNPKYEVLAEYAVRSLLDNYHRECVASFASALERLFEDFVKLTARVNNIDETEFQSTWKPMSKRSERQAGAFSFCWLNQTGSSFRHLSDKPWIEFRNDVIHKGIIPSYDESIQYGQAVIDCARPIIEVLHSEKYDSHRIALIFERAKLRTPALKDCTFSSCGISSPLGFDAAVQRFDLIEHVSKRKGEPRAQQMVDTIRAHAPQIEVMIQSQRGNDTTVPSQSGPPS